MGEESYLDLGLNTTGITFSGSETFGYEIYLENVLLTTATVTLQENSSGSFANIASSSYGLNTLTAAQWVSKSVTLPTSMQNKSLVTLRLKVASSDGVNTFSNLRIDNVSISGGTLPVQLASFQAMVIGTNVELRWSTSTETNNFGFEVERRFVPGQLSGGWLKAGFVEGSGTSTSARQYVFIDNNLTAGRYVYRIKQIDNDATYTRTAIVRLLSYSRRGRDSNPRSIPRADPSMRVCVCWLL